MRRNKSLFKTILWAGFLTGLLDILAAMSMYYISFHKSPLNIFLFIASGIFGKNAFSGHWSMIIFGILFHFLIAYIVAVLFFLIYPSMKLLFKNRVVTAIISGVFIWLVMNIVILPLSKAPQLPLDSSAVLKGVLTLIIAVGLPLSFIAYNFYYRNTGAVK